MKRTLWNICTAGILCVIVFCTWELFQQYRMYKDAQEEYDQVKESVLLDNSAVSSSSTSEEANEQKNIKKTTQKKSASPDKKDVICSIPQVNFEELKVINDDVIGWLYFPEQEGDWNEISYPVLHGNTNEQYLHTTISGATNFAGSLFSDERNSNGFLDYHTIIYGHTMKDGSMFGQLKYIRNSQTIQDPRFWIITENFIYEYTLYCLREVSASNEEAYMMYPSYSDTYTEFIRNENAQSEKEFPLPNIGSESRTVTLSTCVGTGEDGERLVMRGLLTNKEENQ